MRHQGGAIGGGRLQVVLGGGGAGLIASRDEAGGAPLGEAALVLGAVFGSGGRPRSQPRAVGLRKAAAGRPVSSRTPPLPNSATTTPGSNFIYGC